VKTVTLKGERAFERAAHDGCRFGRGILQLRLTGNSLQINRIGIVIPQKAIRDAVDRNRVRRLIHEAYRSIAAELSTGNDIVVIVRAKPSIDKMSHVKEVIVDLFTQAGLLKNADNRNDLI